MSWDYEKTLSDIGESLSDVLKSQYILSYTKESQPLLQKSFSGMVVPLIILVIIGIAVLKWKA
jgi:hypothetical protein